jgi:AcrR family transcriptional regulator
MTPVKTKAGLSTRERILREASQLFAAKSYFGVSTHMIAAKVGIRQPSLFYHFASKTDIARELLVLDLEPPNEMVAWLADADASPAARIYAYVVFETQHVTQSKYNLLGLQRRAVLSDPAFSREHAMEKKLYDRVEKFIATGIRDGELIDLDPRLAREMITGLVFNAMRLAHESKLKTPDDFAPTVADFALRALLVSQEALPGVRAGGLDLVARGPSAGSAR